MHKIHFQYLTTRFLTNPSAGNWHDRIRHAHSSWPRVAREEIDPDSPSLRRGRAPSGTCSRPGSTRSRRNSEGAPKAKHQW